MGCWLKIEMRLGRRKKGGIIRKQGEGGDTSIQVVGGEG